MNSKLPSVSHPSSQQTCRRMMETAGEIFAEHGFHDATVREICRRAKVNLAAVNYHYGGKAGLYSAVLRYAHRRSVEKYPPDLGLTAGASPEERLHAYILSFLLRIFGAGPSAWHGKLMSHEMMNPTHALDGLLKEEMRPRAEFLEGIVQSLIGPEADEQTIRLCGWSIVGQCLLYRHSLPVLERLYPKQKYGEKDIERLAEHITRFSLAALKDFAAQRNEEEQ